MNPTDFSNLFINWFSWLFLVFLIIFDLEKLGRILRLDLKLRSIVEQRKCWIICPSSNALCWFERTRKFDLSIIYFKLLVGRSKWNGRLPQLLRNSNPTRVPRTPRMILFDSREIIHRQVLHNDSWMTISRLIIVRQSSRGSSRCGWFHSNYMPLDITQSVRCYTLN